LFTYGYAEYLLLVEAGADPRGATGTIASPKTYESNIFHHDFVQFRKTLDCQRIFDCQILLKSPTPLNLRAGSAPELRAYGFEPR